MTAADSNEQNRRPSWFARLLAGWRDRGVLIRHLDDLDPSERRRILTDAGLQVHDLPVVDTARHVNELLPLALNRHDIDVDALDQERRDVLHGLQRNCAACGDVPGCRDVMAKDGPLDDLHRICPNTETLTSLKG